MRYSLELIFALSVILSYNLNTKVVFGSTSAKVTHQWNCFDFNLNGI